MRNVLQSLPRAGMLCIPLALAACASTAPAAAPHAFVYRPELTEAERTRVLVLATSHLAEAATPPSPADLEPLLRVLERFEPVLIVNEHLPAEVLEDMSRRDGYWPEVMGAIGMRGRQQAGDTLQQRLGTTPTRAREAAEALLSGGGPLDDAARRRLVALLVAAYEWDSAALQWSLLSPEARLADTVLGEQVRGRLERYLASSSEGALISIPLARRLGHSRLAYMDDHWDAAVFFEIGRRLPGELQRIAEHPESAHGRDVYLKGDSLLADATQRGGSILGFYEFINSPEYAAADVDAQWGRYFRTRLPSGADRARMAQWEARNLRMAAHIRQLSALHPGRGILVVVGTAHKPFLDRYLAQMLDIRVVQLSEL
jgi:hypothetical protein